MYIQTKPRGYPIRQALPLVKTLLAAWQAWRREQVKPCYHLAPRTYDSYGLPFYPVDMEPLLSMPFGYLDQAGVLYNAPGVYTPGAYQPTTIAQYALAQWNAYLSTRDEEHKKTFMTQAQWLVNNGVPLTGDSSGWPIPLPSSSYNALKPWLSALTQGNCVSVLVRAYRLTDEEIFLQVVRRAIRSFELDIQNGGVCVFVGDDGIFFEEVAVSPAAHILNGYILALFGLYDYVALTGDPTIEALIQRSLATLHTFIHEFDLGYWSCYDLLFKRPTTRFYHSLHVVLLKALARYSHCEHCLALARRWEGYQQSPICNLRYYIASLVPGCCRVIQRKLQGTFSPSFQMRKSSVSHLEEQLEPNREATPVALHKNQEL